MPVSPAGNGTMVLPIWHGGAIPGRALRRVKLIPWGGVRTISAPNCCFDNRGWALPLIYPDRKFEVVVPSAAQTQRVVSVLVADQSRMVSQLLASSLARKSRFKILGTAVEADQALQILNREQAEVAVIAVNLKDGPLSGFSLLTQLRTAHPRTRAIVLLDSPDDNLVVSAFRTGARGVFCRSGSVKMLCKCIYAVHQGQIWANTDQMQVILGALTAQVPPHAGTVSPKQENLLSKREREVLACVADGLKNREIARRLQLSEHTVKNYLFRLCDKVGSSGRVELMLYALTRGELADAPADHRASDAVEAAVV
jgi:two-component system nitrate/nitrite response regulator NarL